MPLVIGEVDDECGLCVMGPLEVMEAVAEALRRDPDADEVVVVDRAGRAHTFRAPGARELDN